MWRTKYCRSVWAERVLNAFQCISEQGLLRVRATCCILAAIAVLSFLPENASPLLRWVFYIRISLAGKSCSTPAGWLLTLRKPSPIMTLQFSYYAHWIIDGRPNVSSWLHCLAAKLKMASNRIAETVLIGPFWLWLSSLLRDITTVRWSHNIFSKPMWMQWMQLWYLNFGAPTFAPPVPMLLPISWTQPTRLSLGMHRNNWCNFWKQLQCHVTQWPSKSYQNHLTLLIFSLALWAAGGFGNRIEECTVVCAKSRCLMPNQHKISWTALSHHTVG